MKPKAETEKLSTVVIFFISAEINSQNSVMKGNPRKGY